MAVNNSINTNVGAAVALRNLASVNRELSQVQDRVSTGQKVGSAKDDASIFAVAQGVRADLKAYEAVSGALGSGKGLLSVGISSLESVSTSLASVKAKLVQLADQSLTSQQRTIYNDDLKALLGDVRGYLNGARYNGTSLLVSAASSSATGAIATDKNVLVISGPDGTQLTLRNQGSAVSGFGSFAQVVSSGVGLTIGATAAAGALSKTGAFATFFNKVAQSLGQLGADLRRVDQQLTFNTAISDATDEGLGALVDADLAKESARLNALQTKQQLSIQALGIANQSPTILLNLFR